ncbi:MAG: T9SS type A sorting domain-containing protein [Candidatus Kapabacteria bacterium]|nr:T9SS type A sorting domain-containing protein [Candidatus Kapabacteria bacterium]
MKHLLLILCCCPLFVFAQKPTVKFGAEQTVGCAPFTVNFLDSSSTDVIIWEWDVDNNGVYDYFDPNPVHTYTTPGLYSVRLMVSNLDDSSFLIKQRFIRVVAPPNVSLQSNLTLCEDDTAIIRPIMTGGVRPYTFFWELNGTVPQISIDSTPKLYISANSTLRVTVTDSAGCEVIRDLPLNIIPKPSVTVSANGRNLEASAGFTSYQWYSESGLIQGATQRQYTVPDNQKGNYSVRIRNTTGCSAQSSPVFIDVKTSVAYEQPDGWYVYPNPLSSEIRIIPADSRQATVELLSLMGELLQSAEVSTASVFTVSELPSGMYILRIREPHRVQYLKLIKE